MKSNPDANPLWNSEGNSFTDELIDFWENQARQLIGSSTEKITCMKIEGQEVTALLDQFRNQRLNGNQYMGFEVSDKPSESGSITFFPDKVTAAHYSNQVRSLADQHVIILPILEVEKNVNTQLLLQEEYGPNRVKAKDIVVDLQQLTKAETARQQIFQAELQQQLEKLGIRLVSTTDLQWNIQQDKWAFELSGTRMLEGKEEWFTAKFTQDHHRAFQIEAVLPELDARMEKIDWRHAYYDPLEQNVEVESLEDRRLMHQIWRVVDDVQDLAQSGPDGLKRALELEQKYWRDTPMEGVVSTLIKEPLKENVMKENVNEENFQYLSNQLKFKGFGESLQPALQEKMKSGEKEFTLGYVPEFAKDKATATLHFKQSDNNDRYFFNRFSLQVKNEQFPDAAQQNFNVYSKNMGNTLKEAYNLMEGRPVYMKLEDKNKQEFEAWGKLNFKENTPNGNFKMDLFNKNYGYDLEKVLSNYAIKELQTPSYKESLLKSLEKGNLQSVTFKVDGKEEKLFITPDLKVGALKVTNNEQKRVPLSTMADLGYINKEFSDQLKQRIAGFQQKQEGPKVEAPKQDGQKVDGPKQAVKEAEKPPRKRQRNKIS